MTRVISLRRWDTKGCRLSGGCTRGCGLLHVGLQPTLFISTLLHASPTQVARRKFAFAREAAGYAHLQEGDGQEPVNAVYYKDNGDQYRPHCDGECGGGRYHLGSRLATGLSYCQVGYTALHALARPGTPLHALHALATPWHTFTATSRTAWWPGSVHAAHVQRACSFFAACIPRVLPGG